MILRFPPVTVASLLLFAGAFSPIAQAQQAEATLGEVVVSGNRSEQRRFDVPGAIDAVEVDRYQELRFYVERSLRTVCQTLAGLGDASLDRCEAAGAVR